MNQLSLLNQDDTNSERLDILNQAFNSVYHDEKDSDYHNNSVNTYFDLERTTCDELDMLPYRVKYEFDEVSPYHPFTTNHNYHETVYQLPAQHHSLPQQDKIINNNFHQIMYQIPFFSPPPLQLKPNLPHSRK